LERKKYLGTTPSILVVDLGLGFRVSQNKQVRKEGRKEGR
jgi:hypothetical protein